MSSPPHLRALLVLVSLVLAGCQPRLEPGEKLERMIALDEHQQLELRLERGLFYHLVAEQPTADVVLTLYDPSGQRVHVDVDATSPGQLEHLYYIPPSSGTYTLDIHGLDLSVDAEDGLGRYTLDLAEPRPPSDQDRLVEQAFWAESRGLELAAVKEDYRAAAAAYETAVDFWGKASRSDNVAMVRLELGDCYMRLGRAGAAQQQFQQVLEQAVESGNRARRGKALTALGRTSRALGNFGAARRYHQQALEMARERGRDEDLGRALNNLCVLFVEMGKPEAAEKTCEEALGIYDLSGQQVQKIRTLQNLAGILRVNGEWRRAAEMYERALAMDPGIPSLELRILGNLSTTLERLDEPEQSRKFAERALALSVELGFKETQARHRALLANLSVSLGEPKQAHDLVQQALRDLSQIDDVVAQVSVLAEISRVYWRTGSIREAASSIDRAHELLEHIRRSPRNVDDRASFLDSRWAIYDLRVAIRMSLFHQTGDTGWRDAAFHAAEQARARSLIDRLTASQSQSQSGEGRGDQPAAKILGVSEIHDHLLDSSTGLLLFHLGEEKSFLWSLAAGESEVFELPSRNQIAKDVVPFRKAMTAREQRPLGESGRGRVRRIALADKEVWKAAADLAIGLRLRDATSVETIERWIVIPDGVLHQVPFAALNVRKSQPQRPLLADYEIVYAPSASSLAVLRSTSTGAETINPESVDGSGHLLALADPVFSPLDPRHPLRAEAEELGDLARLPLTRAEVEEIADLVPGQARVVTDHAASKRFLLEQDLTRYDFIHFATHGLVDQDEPSRSALVLSLFDEGGQPIDGYLGLDELSTLDLDARLVVLSACRSASGRQLRGEGVLGLARSFMNAGVPRVVASQWAVQDGVTRDLMTSFYEQLWRHGQDPSRALRQAQLELWRAGLPPYHWASFSFQGDWR